VTVKVAHVRLCHSRMLFVRAYPRESQEMVFDAHARAFAFFRGTCTRGIYDNMKTAVETVLLAKTASSIAAFCGCVATIWSSRPPADNNKYSVASRTIGRPVEIHAYAERIVIRQDGAIVGEHRRRFGRGETIYNPWHYVRVLARKPGALRNGAPFRDWPLPTSLERVRRKLKGSEDGDRHDGQGPVGGADRRLGCGRGGLCRGAQRWRAFG